MAGKHSDTSDVANSCKTRSYAPYQINSGRNKEFSGVLRFLWLLLCHSMAVGLRTLSEGTTVGTSCWLLVRTRVDVSSKLTHFLCLSFRQS